MRVKLSDIADINSGYSFRGRVEDDPAGDLAIVNIGNIKPGIALNIDALKRISSSEVDGLYRYQLKKGDVLFQSHGSKNGAIALDEALYGVAASGLYVIRIIKNQVLPAYLVWYINHKNCQVILENLRQGTGIPRVSRAEISMLKIYLPSLERQSEIVHLAEMLQRQNELREKISELTSQYIDTATWQLAKN